MSFEDYMKKAKELSQEQLIKNLKKAGFKIC